MHGVPRSLRVTLTLTLTLTLRSYTSTLTPYTVTPHFYLRHFMLKRNRLTGRQLVRSEHGVANNFVARGSTSVRDTREREAFEHVRKAYARYNAVVSMARRVSGVYQQRCHEMATFCRF